ncbi:MAG: class I SAM-dependent methyltransferase [Elusimicrobia bacterium]|nr:class I SAM-dependent methyltransferase [Elusimicrobiota bacterium]
MPYELSHLDYSDDILGPIQPDEALLLYGLVRVLAPRVVVEIGFCEGHSARNFLKALGPDSVLYSFDPDPACAERAAALNDPRLRFVAKRQEDFLPDDIDRRPIDLLFIDASHDPDLNLRFFDRVRGSLAESAIVAVHDTGTWDERVIPVEYGMWIEHARDVVRRDPAARVGATEVAHQPGERRFVNRLKAEHPELEQLHLHSVRVRRHGLTLLQRYRPLP